jgi:hypothetical protein
VESGGIIDEWPEHWDRARAAECWLCPKCSRLYVGVNGSGPVHIYALERIGIEGQSTGFASQLGSMEDLQVIAQEQSGESPFDQNP